MVTIKTKMLVLLSMALIFTGTLLLGFHVFSVPSDSTTSPDATPGPAATTSEKTAPIPWFALKWAQETQLLDPQTRRERLAEVLNARADQQQKDPQLRWEKRLKGLAWDLLTTVTKYAGPEEYIEKYVSGGSPGGRMRYHLVLAMVSPEQLPMLYDMLNDDTYAAHWHKIASVIGMIGDDEYSADVMWDYFQRDDSWSFSNRSGLTSKIYGLAWLGNIGSEKYDEVLRQAVTLEGAEELARNWIDEPELVDSVWKDNSRKISLDVIRSRALKGLVFSERPENINLVRQLYRQELEWCKAHNEKTKFMSSLVDAMAYNNYIEDEGKDLLLLELSVSPPLGQHLTKYIKKFTWSPKNKDL